MINAMKYKQKHIKYKTSITSSSNRWAMNDFMKNYMYEKKLRHTENSTQSEKLYGQLVVPLWVTGFLLEIA